MKTQFTHNLSVSLRTIVAAARKNEFAGAIRKHAARLLIVPALALGGLTVNVPVSAQVIYGSVFAKGPFDKDGFPVVVSERLAQIQKAYGQKTNTPEFRKAFEQLNNDLPYPVQTRQLFVKAGLLLERLRATKDSKIAAQTSIDLQAIQRQLELDAIYQRLVQAGLVRSNREQQDRDRAACSDPCRHACDANDAPGAHCCPRLSGDSSSGMADGTTARRHPPEGRS